MDFATEDFRQDGYGFDRFECARLTVPLDYDNPSAQASTVTLGVMRSPARGPAERIGTLIAVPDASGLGMDLAAFSLGSGPGEHLNERFDVIGFDRRGAGASEPLIACLPGPDLDRIRETPTRTRTDAEVSAANAEMAMFMPACVQNSAADANVDPRELLRHSGSAETVEDLDVLRGVLGEDRVSLVAYSHGGRIAAAYAAEHPDRVRALLLDSPYLAEDSSDFRRAQLQAQQAAFEGFAAWCAPVKTCPLGDDPAQATKRYQALVRPLLDQPLRSFRDPARSLSFDDAVAGTVVGLADDSPWEDLFYSLIMLSEGKPDPLLETSDEAWWRDSGGDYHLAAATVLFCVDGPAPPTGAGAERLAADVASIAPFLDSGDPARALDTECAAWPEPPRFAVVPRPDGAVTPTLVIAVRGDIAVPYQLSDAAADAMGAGLLTVEGAGHTSYLVDGNGCVEAAGTAFLVALTQPGPDAGCP